MSVHNVVEELNDPPASAINFGGALTSKSSSSGVGYSTGAGGSVTQGAGSGRATAVTVNAVCGAIVTDDASLAAEASAEFVVTNSAVSNTDTVVVSERSGSNGGNTIVHVTGVALGSFNISVTNNNVAAGTAETGAIIINFVVIKSVTV